MVHKKRRQWFTEKEYPKRLQKYLDEGYKVVGDRIVDVGRPKHHYLKLKILEKGKHRVSVGKLVKHK